MERHKRRSRGQWEELVGDQERSGLSAKDFCKGKTIGLASFYQWRGRLREKESRSKGGIESKGSFIDMGQINSAGVSAPTGVSPWVVTLDMGDGFKLTLQRG